MAKQEDKWNKIKIMCGIVGIFSKKNYDVSFLLYYALLTLQHRGQESCGIVTRNNREFRIHKGMGLVTSVFHKGILSHLKGNVGIGHTRYSTTGKSSLENSQPILLNYSLGKFAIVHNGNIANAYFLRKELESKGHVFSTTTDTEIIAHLIIRNYIEERDIVEAIRKTSEKIIGSYSLLILMDDYLISVRDPYGIRPLCLGMGDDLIAIASENVVFDVLEIDFIRDIEPGEILIINNDGSMESYFLKRKRKAFCAFEYIYFARADSILNGISVYKVRERLGEIMARKDFIDGDFVSPVPDSAIPYAIGYANYRKIPYRESLIRNRYVGRTFIMPKQSERKIAVRLKLNPISHEIKDKRIILIDDSIVRGTTSKRIINMLKKAGAKEVHYRVCSPMIISPCLLGIDMPTKEELIAYGRSVEEIRREINADSLIYLTVDELVEGIGLSKNELCLGCFTGKYPIEELERIIEIVPKNSFLYNK